jgi:hypothetical protein
LGRGARAAAAAGDGQMDEFNIELRRLAFSAFEEFDDIADYIWSVQI